jgi:hypothetical protein
LSLSLNPPRDLGTAFTKVFFGVGLTLPVITGVLSILFLQLGLMTRVEIYPWDDVLAVLFLLALFITPESICVYLFHNKIIKNFMPRMAFMVIVVFLYANYIFLLPPSIYSFLPEAAGTLLWAVWPPIATLVIGLIVGRIESKHLFIESMFSKKASNETTSGTIVRNS